MYYLIIAAIVLLDQMIKALAYSGLDPAHPVTLLDGVLYLTYVENKGAAYNILSQYPALLIILPAVLLTVAIIFLTRYRKKAKPMLLLSVAMIAGGGIGNLVDRIVRGYVVDFFNIRIIPVFNIADIFICIGAGLFCIYVIFFDKREDERRKNL
ncbi:MAG TPA: signal peptidase II [Bacillota bacterium]|nr:signal peptidase II [Bacillota bacterium]HUM55828.1 signal peptidase II [Bacillota bacterium]